jgi:hypothetical protein
MKDRPDLLESLGHDGPPKAIWFENLVTEEPIEICPLRAIQLAAPSLREELWRMEQQWFPLYEKSNMLVAGGIEDQPARWLDWMQAIERMNNLSELRYLELTSPERDSDE